MKRFQNQIQIRENRHQILSSLQIIGELNQIARGEQKKMRKQNMNQSVMNFKVKSMNNLKKIDIFKSSSLKVLHQVKSNPFLMKKYQLSLKDQMKNKQQKLKNVEQNDNQNQQIHHTCFRIHSNKEKLSKINRINELKQIFAKTNFCN